MSGREEVDCSRQSEQQHERHGWEPNDKLDCATDKTLAEADRKSLRGLCRWSKLARYRGLPVFKALKVSVAILNLMRASMGSQWSLFKVDELESVKPVLAATRAKVASIVLLPASTMGSAELSDYCEGCLVIQLQGSIPLVKTTVFLPRRHRCHTTRTLL